MGANISLNDSTAVIRGVDQLSAAPVMASDLRASAALVLAVSRQKGQQKLTAYTILIVGMNILTVNLRRLALS